MVNAPLRIGGKCWKGHEIRSKGDLYTHPDGSKRCRKCIRKFNRRWKAIKAAKVAENPRKPAGEVWLRPEPIERAIQKMGGIPDLAYALASHYPETNRKAWDRRIRRAIADNKTRWETIESCMVAADMEHTGPPYRQLIWRVVGLQPTWDDKLRQKQWFYTRERDAMRRGRKLKKENQLVEFSIGEALWVEEELD